MTIAACHSFSAEGVVFGADSTATMFVPGPGPNQSGASHQFNCARKSSRSATIVRWALPCGASAISAT